MNKKRVHTPEGVRDVYGTEYGQRSKLKAKLNKVLHLTDMKGSELQDLNSLMYLTVKKEPYPQGRCLNSSIEKEIP